MMRDRIERALRQRGPRELGGGVRPLPANLDDARAELHRLGRGRMPPRPVGIGAGLVAAAVVVIAIAVSATRLAPPPQTGDQPGQTPTAAPQIGACAASSLEAFAEPWGAAAGSRGAMVTVANAGTEACTLHGSPGATIVDADGAPVVVAESAADAVDPVLRLSPGEGVVTSVVWSNWCGPEPRQPLAVSLVVSGEDVPVTPDPSSPSVLVPPCMGNGPSQLSTIAFQPAP